MRVRFSPPAPPFLCPSSYIMRLTSNVTSPDFFRQINIKFLHEKVLAYGLPVEWQVDLHPASIVMTSPRKDRVIKVDSNMVVTIDIISNGDVDSTTIKCTNIAAAWTRAEHSLNALLKRAALFKRSA